MRTLNRRLVAPASFFAFGLDITLNRRLVAPACFLLLVLISTLNCKFFGFSPKFLVLVLKLTLRPILVAPAIFLVLVLYATLTVNPRFLVPISRTVFTSHCNKLYLCGTVPLSHIHIIFTVYIVYKPPRERVQWL